MLQNIEECAWKRCYRYVLHIEFPFKKEIRQGVFHEYYTENRQVGFCRDSACDTPYRKHRLSNWTKDT